MSRIVVYIFLLFVVPPIYGQVTISYEVTDAPLVDVLSDLEDSYGLRFSYAPSELVSYQVTIKADEVDMQTFLHRLLDPFYCSFELLGGDFITVKNSKTFILAIQDLASKQPLPFATIDLREDYNGLITNAEGTARLTLTNALQRSIACSYVGYEPLIVRFDTIAYQDTIRLFLQPGLTYLDEVVVKEYLNRGVVVNHQTSAVVIKPQELQVLPGLPERDVLLSAQMLAGVNANDESASGINIRGGSMDQTSYYWNHIPVYNPAHYFGNISSFIPSAVGSLEVYKNCIPVFYGGAVGGLMNITSRELEEGKELAAEVNLNLTHGDVYLQKDLLRWGQLLIAGRRSHNDFFLTPTFSSISEKVFAGTNTDLIQTGLTGGSFEFNSLINFQDYNAVWDIDLGGQTKATASWIYSQSQLDYDTDDGIGIQEATQQEQSVNHGFGLHVLHSWNEHTKTEASVSNSLYDLTYSTENIENFNDYSRFESRENSLDNLEVRLVNQLKINDLLHFDFGGQWNRFKTQRFIYSEDIVQGDEDIYSQIDRVDGEVYAGFAGWSGGASDWNFDVIARVNHYPALSTTKVDRQARVGYAVSQHLDLSTSIGVYHQYLSTLRETALNLSNFTEQLWTIAGGIEGAGLITNRQQVLSMLYHNRGWMLDVDVYRRDLEGINAQKLIRSADVDQRGNERVLGMDLMVRKRFRKYSSWLSYSFQHSEASVEALSISNVDAALNIPHQLQMGTSYQLRQVELSAGYTIKSGVPYTPASGIDQRLTDDNEIFYTVAYEAPHSARLPAFHRLDVSAWYHFSLGKGAGGEAGISLINLLNQQNVFDRVYTSDDNDDGDFLLIQRDKYLYGFTPNCSLRIIF